MLKIIYQIVREGVKCSLPEDSTVSEINTYCAIIMVSELKLAQTEVAKVMGLTNRTICTYVKNPINQRVIKKIKTNILERLNSK